jgi:hypothetical protein
MPSSLNPNPDTSKPAHARFEQQPHFRGFSATRQERFELPTFGSVDRRSIQLSYWRRAMKSSGPTRPAVFWIGQTKRGGRYKDRTPTLCGNALASCKPGVSGCTDCSMGTKILDSARPIRELDDLRVAGKQRQIVCRGGGDRKAVRKCDRSTRLQAGDVDHAGGSGEVQ